MSPAGSASPGPRLVWLPWTALVAVAALAWAALVAIERAMGHMDMGQMGPMGQMGMGAGGAFAQLARPMMHPGAAGPYLAATALMWVVMMVAMMMPAVLPMARVVERAGRGSQRGAHPLPFAAGYLGVWSGFGVVAALLQWALHRSGWLFGDGLALAPALGGGVLVAAGAYQLTPWKDACLRHCRSPLAFVLEHWREGGAGALQMGLRHAAYCVGCCWMLMLLMFAGGAMSVLWMAAISVFILLERVVPEGPWVARLPGLGLVALGLGVWVRG